MTWPKFFTNRGVKLSVQCLEWTLADEPLSVSDYFERRKTLFELAWNVWGQFKQLSRPIPTFH